MPCVTSPKGWWVLRDQSVTLRVIPGGPSSSPAVRTATVGLMLGQRRRRWTNIKPTVGRRLTKWTHWIQVLDLISPDFTGQISRGRYMQRILVDMGHWHSAVVMLGHRRGRWTSIKITLVQCLMGCGNRGARQQPGRKFPHSPVC